MRQHPHTSSFYVRLIYKSSTIPPSTSPRKHPSSVQDTFTTDNIHSGLLALGNRTTATALPPISTGVSERGGRIASQSRSIEHKHQQIDEHYELSDYSQIQARRDHEEKQAKRATKYAAKRAALEEQALRDAMKFAHSIQFNAVPDWTSHYIAYSNLKKLYVPRFRPEGLSRPKLTRTLYVTEYTNSRRTSTSPAQLMPMPSPGP